eukprot:GHVN01028108.1.p1 GENE.GHVN01028108.1~~GHVN01028108.1.p1  ORF type:complete len:544 (+),score=99.66 GHVN01028108.1:148-1779(+)
MQSPVLVLKANTEREHGRKTQLANIQAGKTVSEVIRTTLGPNSMLKMILDPMGGIVITNDGNAILRELEVAHPAAKSLIELSRAQDEEVGDGTTGVVVLAGEMLAAGEPFLNRNTHPTVIVSAFLSVLEDSVAMMKTFARQVNLQDDVELESVVMSCLSTKFVHGWGDRLAQLAIDATRTVQVKLPSGKREIDIKRYVRIEKIPGGDWGDSEVLKGVMVNKDVTHPKMPRLIKNPRVLLLDCPLEYKKGESQTNVEVTREEDWEMLLQQEEIEVKKMCDEIIAATPTLVFTEKGVSDLAQHFLLKAGISVIRRVRKTDNNRIAKVTGATICTRTSEVSENDIGTRCGLFKVEKIADDYFSYLVECEEPRACTVVLRGASKDVLNEIERNLQDALNVARNIMLDGLLVPGGGATEMELAARLSAKSKTVDTIHQFPYRAAAAAFEIIPKTLAQNCGIDVVRTMSDLRARHATPGRGVNFGFDGESGEVIDVSTKGIWDAFAVKEQVFKGAIETAAMILRIDDVLSGTGKTKEKPLMQQDDVMEG